ncbi:MAG: hypothetical protein UR60_C0010G0016 [Candidatus Moranbacteria bacterium GW2011_GWF2_34_56]|nr:MAG: hypothetical protein UR51_C0001G0039 [Candidatus Moranbacteria bacterium GW2011_GWF1_34_10]KKP65027.1 MAG: hypothetical protein UR60_C0010G0016 [Candidatus Moranbacteria bacterium GW2011_GWF2_34_56]
MDFGQFLLAQTLILSHIFSNNLIFKKYLEKFINFVKKINIF